MTEPALDMRSLEGAVLGERYRLERFLDEGAFGAVFKATHLAYGVPLRDVAIKVAKRPMSDAQARRTFADALLMTRVADAAPAACGALVHRARISSTPRIVCTWLIWERSVWNDLGAGVCAGAGGAHANSKQETLTTRISRAMG